MANQKQELPVAAMFVNGSGRSEQSLYIGPSIDASYQISDQLALRFQRRRLKCEKLTDDKWWQKVTLPLARWAKNVMTKKSTRIWTKCNSATDKLKIWMYVHEKGNFLKYLQLKINCT